MEGILLEGIEIAKIAVDAASDKQDNDIILLDTRKMAAMADYFVICSGESDRQLQAITEEIEYKLKQAGVVPVHQEGSPDSGWMLMDYGDVVVHVFAPPEREFYQLEKLWERAGLVLRLQ